MAKHLVWLLFTPVLLAAAGCEATKSSTPLSPSVAGPIPGVNISEPKPLEPNGAEVPVDQQPVTLLIENASTSGVRPLSYAFEVATDASFTNRVFLREGIVPGDAGRTGLRLPDPLATGRTYYWRAHAEDGANTGPYSPAANFKVFTPIVIEQPVPVSPVNNVKVPTLRPRFTFNNAPRSGPVGAISYVIEVSDSDWFAIRYATWTVAEQPNQTSTDAPQDGPYSKQLFWRVRAYDGTTMGPWSAPQVFQTPDPVVVIPPGGDGGGGGGGGGDRHVPAGPLTADRASQVVYATAREFPSLTAVKATEQEAVAAADQLLLRTIWHLQLAGFRSGRQRNPSGAISSDKLTIFIDGAWHVYDIFRLGVAGRATEVQFLEIDRSGANHVPHPGIPD